jgi:hypothetical protein
MTLAKRSECVESRRIDVEKMHDRRERRLDKLPTALGGDLLPEQRGSFVVAREREGFGWADVADARRF